MSEKLAKAFDLRDTPPVTTPRSRVFVFTEQQVRNALIKVIETQSHDVIGLPCKLHLNENHATIVVEGG